MPHILVRTAATFAAFLLIACETAGPARASAAPTLKAATDGSVWSPIFRPKDTMTATFEHHDTWVGQSLQFPPFDKLRIQLEKQIGRGLQNRGEAHITVLTPPEFETVKKCLSIMEIEALFDPHELQNAAYIPECIGRGVLGAPPFRQESYYVVVQAPKLFALRKKLEDAAAKKGCGGFSAGKYHAHITLGFDQRDLHEADGVIKSAKSCVYPIKAI